MEYSYDIDLYRWHLPVEENDYTWVEECINTAPGFAFTAEDIFNHAQQFLDWRDRGGPPENAWGSCILSKISTNEKVSMITGCFDSPISYSIRAMITHPDFRDQEELLASSQEMGKWILYRSNWKITNIGIHLAEVAQASTLSDKWSMSEIDSKIWGRSK